MGCPGLIPELKMVNHWAFEGRHTVRSVRLSLSNPSSERVVPGCRGSGAAASDAFVSGVGGSQAMDVAKRLATRRGRHTGDRMCSLSLQRGGEPIERPISVERGCQRDGNSWLLAPPAVCTL